MALAWQQEKDVTEHVTRLAKAARDEGDYLGEQFTQWFVGERVEEVARMTRLLHVVERAGDNIFHVEDFLARESDTLGGERDDAFTGPPTAGGTVD